MKYSFYRYCLFITGIVLTISCNSKSDAPRQQAPPAVAVNVYTVKEQNAVYFDQYPGTVTALNQVDVRPQVAGYINGIYFREGQHVNKGEKLYTIDDQQYRGSYEAAVANLDVSKANLAKAQQDADRYQELAREDAIARQTLDHALADLESSRKQVAAAQANVSAVQTNLLYTTIYAPFTGTIGISNVKLGASVSPGQTILNTISSDDPIAVDFAVDEKQIPRFVKLEKQPIGDSTFSLVLSDQSVYPLPGSIYLIDRAVDPQTGTIKTRLLFRNPDKTLKVGMTCNVRVKNVTGASSLLIPYKAVTEQMNEFFVFVVGDSNKVSQRKIVLGPKINADVLVRSGLDVNEQIVTDGIQRLREGSVVKIGPPPSAGKAAATDSTKGK